MRLRASAAVAVISTALVIGLPMGAAQAGTLPSTTVEAASAQTAVPAAARPASVSSSCSFAYTYNGHTGHFICGTDVWGFQLPDGTVQAFGIGTDDAVWTTWDGSDGWSSMGGVAIDGTRAWADSSSNAVVKIEGTDGNYYCRYRTGSTGKWGAWFQCNGWTPTGSSFCLANCVIPEGSQATPARIH
jgi:hypothetical protein